MWSGARASSILRICVCKCPFCHCGHLCSAIVWERRSSITSSAFWAHVRRQAQIKRIYHIYECMRMSKVRTLAQRVMVADARRARVDAASSRGDGGEEAGAPTQAIIELLQVAIARLIPQVLRRGHTHAVARARSCLVGARSHNATLPLSVPRCVRCQWRGA